MNVIIAQSGGPTSVINSSLAGAIEGGIDNDFNHIYLSNNGIEGILKEHIEEVDQEIFAKDNCGKKLLARPSSILGSCRYKLSDDLDHPDYAKIFEVLRKNAYHKEPYIQTRLMQEMIANFEGEPFMNVSVLRPGLVIGKTDKSILGALINLASVNDKIPVTAGVIPLISAESLAKAAIYALELEGDKKTYAVSTSKISYRDLFKLIIEVMGETDEKTLVDKTFEDLLPAYERDAKLTEKRGLEHGISQVNMLRGMTMDLSFKSDFDLGKEDLKEDIREMIKFFLSEDQEMLEDEKYSEPKDIIENPANKED